MPKIFLSPSDQIENVYIGVDTNEGTQCGKIATACKDALLRCGFDVMLMHRFSMQEKVATADAFGADAYVCIHTNASPKHNATGTRMFCYSWNGTGHKICIKVFNKLAAFAPGTSDSISVRDDLYEIRMPVAPTVYIEVDFHDVADIAKWIVSHTTEIGEKIAEGLCEFFGVPYKKAEDDKDVLYRIQVGAFRTREYAQRYLDSVKKHYPEAFIVEVK